MLNNTLALVASAIVASAVSPPATVLQTDTLPFVVTRLSLNLTVNYDRATLGGTATLSLRNISRRPRRDVALLLNRLMVVTGAANPRGANLQFQQHVRIFADDSLLQVKAIVVDAGRAIGPGDSTTIVIHYGGALVGYSETGSLYIKDKVAREFTIIREDAYAFPRIGVPSHATNRTSRPEPFHFDAQITVPADLVVAMGGTQVRTTKRDSLTTWDYQSTEPVPFLNITVAPYRILEGDATRIFYFPNDSSGARMIERAVSGAMRTFASWYGELQGKPRLTVMEIPEGFGSQASLAAGIIQTADAFRDRSQLRQVYHELSHLWNVTDLDTPSPRWNEGLASFLQWRMAAELDAWSDWDSRLERTVRGVIASCNDSTTCRQVPLAEFGRQGLTDRSYQLGMLMFYALYRALGAAAFDSAYASFYRQHRQGGGTTADLADAFRAVSPRSDAILTDWLFTTRWYARLSAGESFAQIVAGYN